MSGEPVLSEEDLRYWLANEDWYMSRHTRDWLARTPPAEAAEVLAVIAEDAAPEPRSPWSRLITGVAVSGFSPSGAIAGHGPEKRKAGTRAALLLADLNDARGIPPLVRLFGGGGVSPGKYQELVESALLRYLSDSGNLPAVRKYRRDITALAERIHQSGGADLPTRSADLLIAALRALSFGGDTDTDTAALFKGVAGARVAPTAPNRARVREAARAVQANRELRSDASPAR